MKLREPILKSMLDDDLYKFNMGQVVFHDFPEPIVTYEFINRGKTEFPDGFAEELNWQIETMSTMELTRDEALFLKTIPGIRPTYIEWLRGYRFDPSEVVVQQDGGTLSVHIQGPWYRTIFWEVRLMAIISELYFKLTMGGSPELHYQNKICKKAARMSATHCQWIDFGTRRRFSYGVQHHVVRLMKHYPGFLGTSNVHLAMKHGVKASGTFAHECVMAMQAMRSAPTANKTWIKHWSEHFNGRNGIALTDTFTTKVFLRDFGPYIARLYDGVRQDSGDPYEWGIRMIDHYRALGIDPMTKKFVFSDGLDDETFIKLTEYFSKFTQVVGGIGTFLTNDVGVKPLNMVIKLATADFGRGPVDVVKLSDTPGKHTGKPEAIAKVKTELGI